MHEKTFQDLETVTACDEFETLSKLGNFVCHVSRLEIESTARSRLPCSYPHHFNSTVVAPPTVAFRSQKARVFKHAAASQTDSDIYPKYSSY